MIELTSTVAIRQSSSGSRPLDSVGGGDGPVRFDEEYRLDGEAGSTALKQSIRTWPRGPFGFAAGIIRRQLERLIPADLERLKALIEEPG